jgi:hypothetical protein
MEIPKDTILVRIFFGEDDQFQNGPLHEAIVLKAREMRRERRRTMQRQYLPDNVRRVANAGFDSRSVESEGP